jgi:RNA polymerase sigma-70 factor, ECF subfamily
MSDLQDLLQRCQNGDLSAFNQLFRAYEGKIFRLAMSILLDKQDAEDAAQDTFLRVFLRIRSFRGESSFDTWLTAVVINVCRDKLRRNRMRRFLSLEWFRSEPDPSQPDISEAIVNRQQAGELWKLVDRLDDKLRLPIILVYQEGLPVKEAAVALGLPSSTVYSQLKTAHKQLQHLRSTRSHLETGHLGEKGC